MFKGKAIYNPSGKAGEYSYWACNFYTGCSNGCTYCYLKKGRGAKVLGGDTPQLKKCFKNEAHAIKVFEKELLRNLDDIREHGLFFSFTTDPMLSETVDLTLNAVDLCQDHTVPVKILTKKVDYLYNLLKYYQEGCSWTPGLIAIGFTLTGRDKLEPNASTNNERISAMQKLKKDGYKTFASIEPIIDFRSSKKMIEQCMDFCDLFKIGLQSGKKYNILDAQNFVEWLDELQGPKIYLKDSLQKLSNYTNNELDEYFVERDYNLFKDLA